MQQNDDFVVLVPHISIEFIFITMELDGTQILEMVQYFIKYHSINNYYGIKLTPLCIQSST